MKRFLIHSVLTLFLLACAKVPISGRKQMNLLPAGQVMAMSADAYDDFLNKNRGKVLPDGHPKTKLVRKVGNNIKKSATEYLRANGFENRVKGFDWRFNVVKDKAINAWCMSGGRVVFYTGILDVADNKEKFIATVMGHEVAHAIARHGNERMSQQIAIQTGGMALSVLTREKPELTRNLLLQAYGVGSTLGALKYSRKHESEADKMGLVFMAKAGYNPNAAVDFWKRMDAQGGKEPPEFLSTHPNHDTRIEDLKAFMPKAMKFYKGK